MEKENFYCISESRLLKLLVAEAELNALQDGYLDNFYEYDKAIDNGMRKYAEDNHLDWEEPFYNYGPEDIAYEEIKKFERIK